MIIEPTLYKLFSLMTGVLVGLSGAGALAQSPTPLIVSTDTWTAVPSSPSELISIDPNAPAIDPTLSANLPDSVTIDAVSLNRHWPVFSVDIPVELEGTVYWPADAIEQTDAGYRRYFDSRAHGLSAGHDLIALASYGSSTLLSFDTPVQLDAQYVAAGEIIEFDGQQLRRFLSPTQLGIGVGQRIDAAELVGQDRLLVSFQVGGSIDDNRLNFGAADLLSFSLKSQQWLSPVTQAPLLARNDNVDAVSIRLQLDQIFFDQFE